MDVSEELNNGLRCRPGDLARVIYSKIPMLIGRLVLVAEWNGDGRWRVYLLGDPCFGITSQSRRPVVTCGWAFRDSSLEPLSPEDAISRIEISLPADHLSGCDS
jgi:hypothetical protein